jgi:hypothetical protein
MQNNTETFIPAPVKPAPDPSKDAQYIDTVVRKVIEGVMAGLEIPRKAYEAGQIVGFVEGAGLTLLVVIVAAFLFRKKQ